MITFDVLSLSAILSDADEHTIASEVRTNRLNGLIMPRVGFISQRNPEPNSARVFGYDEAPMALTLQ